MRQLFYDFISKLFPEHGIDLTKLDLQIKKRKLDKGEYLLREGEVCQFIGFIIQGCFRIFVIKKDKEITFNFFVGNRPISDYASYFCKQPTQFYVQAIEPSEIL